MENGRRQMEESRESGRFSTFHLPSSMLDAFLSIRLAH